MSAVRRVGNEKGGENYGQREGGREREEGREREADRGEKKSLYCS